MQRTVGIVREKAELEEGLAGLAKLREDASRVKAHATSQYNAGWHEALDLRNLLITSEAVARAALTREESRGAHTRLDFEGERSDWGNRNIVVRKGDDGMRVVVEERAEPDPELARLANASLEDLEAGRV